MILKVVPPHASHASVAAEYFDVGRAPLSTGVRFFHEPPGRANYGDIAVAKLTHIFGVHPEIDKDDDQWPCRFAYWLPIEDQEGLQLVVTTGDIYLMSDRGDTIDRV